MSLQPQQRSFAVKLPVFLILAVLLYLTSRANYLLFHSLAELFSIAVAAGVFMVAWNSREFLDNGFLKYIGIAYLFIGGIDLLHTLSFKGMSVFSDYDYYANQLWIAGRGLESFSLIAAFAFIKKGRKLNEWGVLALYAGLTALIVCTVFVWKIFPECFVEGVGQTGFKIASEYVIIVLLGVSVVLTVKHRQTFDRDVYSRVLAAIICTIASELAFTFYVDNYGILNLVGHYLKLVSFGMVYYAIVRTGIEKPYRLIFRELSAKNSQLEAALADIKTLKGIIPICANCKKIRDDEGYWKKLEQYLHEHADAEFSHGLCPDCVRELYSDQDLPEDLFEDGGSNKRED